MPNQEVDERMKRGVQLWRFSEADHEGHCISAGSVAVGEESQNEAQRNVSLFHLCVGRVYGCLLWRWRVVAVGAFWRKKGREAAWGDDWNCPESSESLEI